MRIKSLEDLASYAYTKSVNTLIVAYNNPHKTAIGAICLGYLTSNPLLVIGIGYEAYSLTKKILNDSSPTLNKREVSVLKEPSVKLRVRTIRAFDEPIINKRDFRQDMKSLIKLAKEVYSDLQARLKGTKIKKK